MEAIFGYPEFAQGALARLALYQATEDDPARDMEPGKILHEIRHGELTELGLLPWAPYYGTHDATSLFLIVLSYLYQWTNDVEVTRRFRPNAEAALAWIDRFGDLDGDGFQEYRRRSPHGLDNQGWKDSWDGVLDDHGRVPRSPLALCELQGFVYDARLRMAELYELWEEPERAEEQRAEAYRLFDRFNDAFWWEEEGTYALGLDADKRQIRSVASNAGLCLASGIVPAERAPRIVERLMAPDMFSGWGIRTLSRSHAAYNPFGYHTGSVWPHDNATIAGGFRRYGFDAAAGAIAEGIFSAAALFERSQLPELFAGLPRDPGSFPVQYLGANVPQAWAAAAVFRFVAVLGGVHCAAPRGRLYANPALPGWLPDVEIRNLRAAGGAMHLRFSDDRVDVISNTTELEVVHGAAPRPVRPPR
jgi:glycogen debranching enzyme